MAMMTCRVVVQEIIARLLGVVFVGDGKVGCDDDRLVCGC